MALTFLYGNSGNGKSEYVYEKIADLAQRAPYQPIFVVVPEQFTLKTQRLLVEHTKQQVILNIDVVSFERLAYRIFDELGLHPVVMEETGKSLVLRRLVEEQEAGLTLLKGNLTKMGAIDELKSLLSELMQYGISPEDLQGFAAELPASSPLRMKLADLLCVYRAFSSYLKEGYVTAEQMPQVLMSVAGESKLLSGAILVFDGYTGFTPVQLQLLERLMGVVSDMYVTVTMDTRELFFRDVPMEALFYMSHKFADSLCRAAKNAGFPVADPIKIIANERSRHAQNPVLAHLEQNLFRPQPAVYEDDCKEALGVYSLANPREELFFAAAKISELVRTNQYRYKDFAIVSSNVAQYEVYAEAVFGPLAIPYFVDTKESVLYHPLIELLRALLEMAEDNYSRESVFRALRTRLCLFEADDVDLLENYCVEKGIRGAARWKKSFLQPFARHGRVKDEAGAAAETLAHLNTLRSRFFELTQDVVSKLKRKNTVKDKTTALYDFLCRLNMEEQLAALAEAFAEQGEERLAGVYRQMYKITVDLFDKLVDLLGEEQLSLSDFADVLEAGFSAAKVGSIPQGSDCVILGDSERSRLDGIKILFFLGVNDGMIPKKTARQSLLSAHDRQLLEAGNLTLAPGEREQTFLQRFYLYWNMTKPSDALYVTFARMDGAGGALRPSYLIGVLKKLFAKLDVIQPSADELLPVLTPKAGLAAYLQGLLSEEVDDKWIALHRWYAESPSWADTIRKLFDAHFSVYNGEALGEELSRLIYGTMLVNSVTRLELFAKCAFAHFMEYGLKLSERREFAFESLDMGSLFHAVLQKFAVAAEKEGGWAGLSDEKEEALLNDTLQEAVLELPNEALLDSARSAYMLERIRRILRRSIWAMKEQLRRGDFRIEGCEVNFAKLSQLSSELQMKTVGSIDRLDVCEDEENVYVKIVDYKSGKTGFQLLSLYHGMQLQLVLYLDAAMEKLKNEYPEINIVPAGIFYFHLDDPKEEEKGEDEAQLRRRLLEKLKLNGLANEERDIFLHMDRELQYENKSFVIPIALKKDGSLAATGTSAATTEQIGELPVFVKDVMTKTGRQMLSGEVSAKPVRIKEKTGCDYCPYGSVCGFDTRRAGYRYDKKEPFSNEEVWEKLKEAQHGKENV